MENRHQKLTYLNQDLTSGIGMKRDALSGRGQRSNSTHGLTEPGVSGRAPVGDAVRSNPILPPNDTMHRGIPFHIWEPQSNTLFPDMLLGLGSIQE